MSARAREFLVQIGGHFTDASAMTEPRETTFLVDAVCLGADEPTDFINTVECVPAPCVSVHKTLKQGT